METEQLITEVLQRTPNMGIDKEFDNQTLRVHVCNLRKKISRDYELLSVRSYGYRLIKKDAPCSAGEARNEHAV